MSLNNYCKFRQALLCKNLQSLTLIWHNCRFIYNRTSISRSPTSFQLLQQPWLTFPPRSRFGFCIAFCWAAGAASQSISYKTRSIYILARPGTIPGVREGRGPLRISHVALKSRSGSPTSSMPEPHTSSARDIHRRIWCSFWVCSGPKLSNRTNSNTHSYGRASRTRNISSSLQIHRGYHRPIVCSRLRRWNTRNYYKPLCNI